MWGKPCFLRTKGRRPIFVGVYPPRTDLQGALPRGWCLCCGTEVFLPGEDLCLRCREKLGG